MNTQEGILHGLLGVFTVMQHLQGEAQRSRVIVLHQPSEACAIAMPCLLQHKVKCSCVERMHVP